MKQLTILLLLLSAVVLSGCDNREYTNPYVCEHGIYNGDYVGEKYFCDDSFRPTPVCKKLTDCERALPPTN